MTSSSGRTADAAARNTPTFRTVFCGIDGSAGDPIAARQAAILAGPEGRLDLVTVIDPIVSKTARIMLTPERARRALRHAHDIAVDAGARPQEHVVEAAWEETGALLNRCGQDDLVVVGTHDVGRIEGILGFRTSTAAVHRAPCPVLVARSAERFPGRVLLADDGGGPSDRAAALTSAIVARHGCEVLIGAPVSLEKTARRRLAEHATALYDVTGREIVIVDVEGEPAHALPELASELDVGLLVLGSRALQGVRALSSVSERVAHGAPCSVLIVRSPSSPAGV